MDDVIPFGKAPRRAGVIETPTYRKIQNVLRYCHENRCVAIIRGGYGVGKSFAGKQYAESSPQDVALVTLNPMTSSMTAGLNALGDSIGPVWDIASRREYRARGYSMAHLQARAIMRFCEDIYCARGRLLLIIDEAQHARPDLLDAFRSIYDQGYCGLVVAGNGKLFNPRKGRMIEADFGALLSRARFRYDFPAPTPGDLAAVFGAFKIVGKDSRELLADCAAACGLRQVFIVIEKAREISGTPIVNYAQLKTAAASSGASASGWTRTPH